MDIIPYDEKLIINDGGFINPDGKIIYTYGEEEKYALHYLRGKDYNYLDLHKTNDTKYKS